MVDIIPSSQLVIGHGAFSIVYRAKLKSVSSKTILHRFKSAKNEKFKRSLPHFTTGKTKKVLIESNIVHIYTGWPQSLFYHCFIIDASAHTMSFEV